MLHWTINLKQTPNGGRPLAAVAVLHKLYSFGGQQKKKKTKNCLNVHVFNMVSLRWTKLNPPPVAGKARRPRPEVPSLRYGHTAVLIEDVIYIWGGCKYGGSRYDKQKYSNVLYAFDVNAHTWSKPEVSGAVPEARWGHSACVSEKVMLICGGLQLAGRTNDTYRLDTATAVWSLVYTRGDPGPVSSDHSATVIGTKMFVFGGRGDKDLDDNLRLRVFDMESNRWLSMPSSARLFPDGRRGHSAFAHNGELYIFGGWDWDRTFDDLWVFRPDTFSWERVEIKGKAPRPMYNMCCCAVGDRVVLFGGYDTPDDLYVLDLSPSLKTLCKLVVIQYGVEQSELPHDIRWELAAMTTSGLK